MTKRRIGRVLAALTAAGFLSISPGAAFPGEAGAPAPAVAAGTDRQAAGAGKDGVEEALLHKRRGDEFRLRDDIPHAGEEYAKALSLYRGFSRDDRFLMARYLSWSGRLDQAVLELKAILTDDPGDIAARNHLARCLAWKGDLHGSLAESSKVLAGSPDDKDALLVRANALKWGGDPEAAKSIYRKILERGDDFDTRMGLSYAHLSAGYLRGAKEEAGRLTPGYPYQEKEVKELNAEIGKAARPILGAGYSYYSDSDDNRLDRYSLSAGLWAGNWKLALGYLQTEARDPSRDADDRDLSLSAESRVTERLGVGASAGVNRTGNDNSGTFPVGSARADLKVFDGRIGAGVARKVFADTAQLIENRIRFTEISAFLEYPLPYRFAFRASYAGREYSDDNRSGDWQGALRYRLRTGNPSVSLGYRVRFLDFRRESGSGYFDPDGYVSHRGELSFYGERGRAYLNLAPFFGHQSFRRRGVRASGAFGGGEGVLGVRVTGSFALEFHGEGSDEAGATASGFNYYQFGVRASARF